jgi:hypothetical protein
MITNCPIANIITIRVNRAISANVDFIPPAEVVMETIDVSTITATTMIVITMKIILLSILIIDSGHRYRTVGKHRKPSFIDEQSESVSANIYRIPIQ